MVDEGQPRNIMRRNTVSNISKADVVAFELANLVVDGQFTVGDYLASENELAKHFSVSRPNIRQALHRLAAAGLVEIRHGVGTFVTPDERWNLFDPLLLRAFVESGNLASIARELVELRKMVEVECAGLAAERITPTELRQLEHYLGRIDAYLDDVARVTEADLAFHEVIVCASHNRFLQGTMSYLQGVLGRARRLTMETGGTSGRRRAQEGHKAIYQAVKAHHVAQARAAMLNHMQQFEKDMERALLVM